MLSNLGWSSAVYGYRLGEQWLKSNSAEMDVDAS